MFTYAHLFPLAFNINIEEFINGYIDGDELIKDESLTEKYPLNDEESAIKVERV